jgi:hypothetical protein
MRRVTILLVVAAFALAVVGCGGSDEAGSDTETVAVTDTTTDETTTEETETDGTDTAETTDASGDFSDCAGLTDATQKLGQALSAASSDEGSLEASSELYQQFADEAPEEIRADVQILADAYAKYVDALKDVDLSSGTPSPDDALKLSQALASIDQTDVAAASQRITTWASANCTTG